MKDQAKNNPQLVQQLLKKHVVLTLLTGWLIIIDSKKPGRNCSPLYQSWPLAFIKHLCLSNKK